MPEQEYQELVLRSQRMNRILVLDRETCDWIIDDESHAAICRTHAEMCDGVDSAHFPGAKP